MLENFFNVFPSILYHGSCIKMRGTFPLKYQLIAKTTEFISMVPRKMCNQNACSAKLNAYWMLVITWKGVSQLFVIGGNGIKVNGTSYLKHPHDNVFPAVVAMYPNKDCKFMQDKVPSHCANQVQNFLKQKFKSRFV